MAASANPSGGGHNNSNCCATNSQGGAGGGHANGAMSNGISLRDSSFLEQTQSALRHNPGLCIDWTPEEQSILEKLLHKYGSEQPIPRYAKIANQLNDKTVRDVALRVRWMNKKENARRRKDDHNSSKKSKDKKEKVTDSAPKSQVTNRSNGPAYFQSIMSMEEDDGISYKAIGGTIGQVLEQADQALYQISANLTVFKVHENINLFCQARNNILSSLNELNDTREIMKQMPDLPVKLNEQLSSSALPSAPLLKKA